MIQLIGAVFGISLVLIVLWMLKWWIIGALSVYLFFRAVGYLERRNARLRATQAAANALLIERADAEHELTMRGDPRGWYGQYPVPNLDE
jgi:hypothetical protein